MALLSRRELIQTMVNYNSRNIQSQSFCCMRRKLNKNNSLCLSTPQLPVLLLFSSSSLPLLLVSLRSRCMNRWRSLCWRPRMHCSHVIVSWPSWGWSQRRWSVSWSAGSVLETSKCHHVTWPSFGPCDWLLTLLPVCLFTQNQSAAVTIVPDSFLNHQ